MTRILRAGIVICSAALAMLVLVPSARASAAIDGYLVIDDGNTGQIYTVTQLGTNLDQLTSVPDGQAALAPRWSPDGSRIAFVIFHNGLDRMYTMAADGSDRHKLRNEGPAWNNDAPDYFPSGERIVFARCHSNGTGCVIATLNSDGSDLQLLTGPGRFEVYDFYPTVSPDGTRIAFVRINADGIHSQIWIMNSDGTGQHPVTAPFYEASLPYWSPDGSHLTFSSNCCRLGGNVYSVAADGGHPTKLTHTPSPHFSGVGAYAPSGREIAFTTDRNYPDKDGADLYLMRVDGAHQVKVSLPLAGIGALDWAPAGG